MPSVQCPDCGRIAEYAAEGSAFCQFCGAKLASAGEMPDSVREIVRRAEKEERFAKKRELYHQALALAPDSFEIKKRLAFLGRMGETGGKPDFSRIPSWPLDCLYQEKQYKPAKRAEMLKTLFSNEPYLAALAAAPDKAAFEAEYLCEMAKQYIGLFLAGNSQIATVMFGFRRKRSEVLNRCALAVERMIENANQLAGVPDELREKLAEALRAGIAATNE